MLPRHGIDRVGRSLSCCNGTQAREGGGKRVEDPFEHSWRTLQEAREGRIAVPNLRHGHRCIEVAVDEKDRQIGGHQADCQVGSEFMNGDGIGVNPCKADNIGSPLEPRHQRSAEALE